MAERTKTLALSEGKFLPQIKFVGTVFSGNGEGRRFVGLPWVKRQIKEKLGFTPYAGTLNIRLSEENMLRKKLLEKAEKFEIHPEKGYCTGFLIEAEIDRLGCGIVLPQVRGYPPDVLEVVAACNLRDRLGLSDGNTVSVDVTV